MRNSGLFIDIKDQTDRLQLFCHKSRLDEPSQKLLPFLSLGDWIGAHGKVRKTPRGEMTLNVKTLTFLAKCFQPMPDKRHGFLDTEGRYRQRYVDLMKAR